MASVAAVRGNDGLKPFVKYSVVLHCALGVLVAVSAYLSRPGENWGGPGGSVTVGLVGNVPAIPLPRPEAESPNRVVDNTKGLYKAEPKPPDLAKDAVPIPKFMNNRVPKIKKPKEEASEMAPPRQYVTRPSKVLENKTPPPPNAVPYGAGGAPTVPTTSFAIGRNGATAAGMNFGGAQGGDFGSRFSWYVEAVQRRISGNWLESTVDPSIAAAPRVVVSFTILRNGTVTNIQFQQRSNVMSVDSSALRAIQVSSPFQPLPGGYSGSYVNVQFWFDFHR
ncbi:MAG: TonB family protein [Acidobacteriota bacterium]|nr:TonB family protein [Acidobacteriota bacterium]